MQQHERGEATIGHHDCTLESWEDRRALLPCHEGLKRHVKWLQKEQRKQSIGVRRFDQFILVASLFGRTYHAPESLDSCNESCCRVCLRTGRWMLGRSSTSVPSMEKRRQETSIKQEVPKIAHRKYAQVVTLDESAAFSFVVSG